MRHTLTSIWGGLALCLTAVSASAQTLPLQGPGFGNLTYTDAELFTEISTIDWNSPTNSNGIPEIRPPRAGSRAYGINVGIMLNGYFVTAFAPDGGSETGGFLVYDVSNPRNIVLKKTVYDPTGTTKDFREPHSFGVTTIAGKTYLAMQSAFGVEFWDFTDVNDIKQIKKLALPGVNRGDYDNVAWQLYWQAPYLYVASGNLGMFIVDARDPANATIADRGPGKPNPMPIGNLGGFKPGPIFTMGNQMVLSAAESTSGFSSFDISDPLNPVLLTTGPSMPSYYATCFNGKKLYSSGRGANGAFAGFNMPDARTITLENQSSTVPEGLYCATQDNNLVIGAQRHILKFDVSNPASYVELGRSARVENPTNVPAGAKSDPDLGQVAMFGNLVFVGGDHGHDTAFRPHQKLPDTTKPVVIAASPVNGAVQQSVTTRIGFGLSDTILFDTVNASNFILRKKGTTTAIPGLYSAQLGIINFSPNQPLEFHTEYEAVLKANGVKDYAGNAIAQDHIVTFKTGGSKTFVNRWPLVDSLTDVASGNDGVASGTVSYNQGGLDFSTRTTGITLESNAVAEVLAASATVTFRMKTSQVGTSVPWTAPGIFGRDQSGGGDDVFWGWIDNQGYLNMSVANVNGSNPGTKSGKPVNDNVWHEIAISRNSDTGEQAVYIDGMRTTSTSAAGVLGISNKLQMLGQIQGNPVAFNGILSDVRVYNRVLSDGEVAAVFKPETASAIKNRWPLSVSLADVVGGNNGTASSADVYSDGGLNFAGRTAGVNLASDTIADTLGGTATVTFRMKTTQVGTSQPWTAPGIFGRDQAGGTSDVFWGWIDAQGRLNMSVGDASTSNPGTKSTNAINDNVWHEIAMTRSADTGAQAIYVDGVATTSVSNPGVMGISSKLQMLGQIQGNSALFQGTLSDVRVYNRVLSAKEISGIFNPDQTVMAQGQVGQAVSINPADLGLSGAQYIWNFGDGSPPLTTTSASPNVSYTYAQPGNYTISVTVVAADGTQTPHAYIKSVIRAVTATAPVHTSNIVGNSTQVYALNPDAGTLAQIGATSLVKNWEIALGKEPKTLALGPSGWLWATVQGDDKFVKIDPVTKAVTSFQLDYGSAPYGILFTPDGTKGVLTLAGKSSIAIFNPTTGAITNTIALPNGDLRGIAISGDSTTAYVTRFRSKMTQGELYKVNLASPTAATTIALPVDTVTLQTEASAPGVANYANQVVISPDGLRAVLPSKKDNIVDGQFRNGKVLKQDTTVRSILSQVNISTGAHVFAEQIDFNNRAPARASLFTPSGNYIFVAQMESNSVEIVDPYRRTIIGSITGTKATPHGLYLDAAKKRLFVNNFLDRSVTAHDISKILTGVDFVTPPPTTIATVTTEPLTASVLAGKKVFYNSADPRMSKEMYISCASCHVDGDSDGMVWDFTQRGEGLRRTISLQGRAGLGHGNVHWTANFNEIQDFEHDIRKEFGGAGFTPQAIFDARPNPLTSQPLAGHSTDLDNLAAYVTSLNTFNRSPARTATGCLTPAALAGQTTFTTAGCASCHSGAATLRDGVRHDVGSIQASSGTGAGAALAGVGFDTPTLYGVWEAAPYFHNGRAATLADVFTVGSHANVVPADEVAGLVTYLRSLDKRNQCPTQ